MQNDAERAPVDLEALRELSERATPGTWSWESDPPTVYAGRVDPIGEFGGRPICGHGYNLFGRLTDASHNHAADLDLAIAAVNYVRAALSAAPKQGSSGEVQASSACPICEQDQPHAHSPEAVRAWRHTTTMRAIERANEQARQAAEAPPPFSLEGGFGPASVIDPAIAEAVGRAFSDGAYAICGAYDIDEQGADHVIRQAFDPASYMPAPKPAEEAGRGEVERAADAYISWVAQAAKLKPDDAREAAKRAAALRSAIAALRHPSPDTDDAPTIWEDPAGKGYPCFERPMTPAEAREAIDRQADRIAELEAALSAQAPEQQPTMTLGIEQHSMDCTPAEVDVERAARAIASFVCDASEEEQQLPALQFIMNRSDLIARSAIATLHTKGPEQ